MQTPFRALLEAVKTSLEQDGERWTDYQIAEAFGWDTRRLSTHLARKTTDLRAIQAAIAHWNKHQRPLTLSFDIHGLKASFDGSNIPHTLRSTSQLDDPNTCLLGQGRRWTQSLLRILQTILMETDHDRVMVLRARTHSEFIDFNATGTLIAEVAEPTFHLVGDQWQDVALDAAYITLLKAIHEEGCVELHTPTMQPGMLRTLYEQSGILSSTVAHIETFDRAMWYLSGTRRSRSRTVKRDLRKYTPRLSVLAEGLEPLMLT